MSLNRKRILRGIGAAIGLVVLGMLGVGAWAEWHYPARFPDVPRPDLKALSDPAVVARGRYLFHAVAHCTQCHTPKDELRGLGAKTGEAVARGGHEWVLGPFGVVRSANITSDVESGIGAMTDSELARLLKHGVRDDDTVAMLMIGVGAMSDEDLVALMSYVRTLPPTPSVVEPSHINTAGKVLLGQLAAHLFMPKFIDVPTFTKESDQPSVARGEYLARGPAFCFACHSPLDVSTGHVKLAGDLMSGGDVVPEPDGAMELVPPTSPRTPNMAAWPDGARTPSSHGCEVVESTSIRRCRGRTTG